MSTGRAVQNLAGEREKKKRTGRLYFVVAKIFVFPFPFLWDLGGRGLGDRGVAGGGSRFFFDDGFRHWMSAEGRSYEGGGGRGERAGRTLAGTLRTLGGASPETEGGGGGARGGRR